MAEFAAQLTQPAVRDLRLVSDIVHSRIIESLGSLRQDPFPAPPLRKKLRGFRLPLYRVRVGNFRVLYRIDGETITVMRVIDRKDLEKAIKRLQS